MFGLPVLLFLLLLYTVLRSVPLLLLRCFNFGLPLAVQSTVPLLLPRCFNFGLQLATVASRLGLLGLPGFHDTTRGFTYKSKIGFVVHESIEMDSLLRFWQ